MAENAGQTPRVDAPVYSYQDVQAFVHLAAITKLLDYRGAIHAAQTADQLRQFAPSERAKVDRLVEVTRTVQSLTSEANSLLTEISNSLIARPHQVAAIQAGLFTPGPWRGGSAESATYPNGVPVDPSDLVGERITIRDVAKTEPPANS